MGRIETDPDSGELQEQKPDFENRLVALADNMRQYDELSALREPLLDAKEALDAQFKNLDLSKPAKHHPKYVVFNALEKVILDMKIDALNGELEALDWDDADSLLLLFGEGLRKRKVKVQSLDPDKYYLSKFTRSDSRGDLGTFLGKSQNAKGKITDLNFNPATGGYMVITPRIGLDHKAAPLIDRAADYSPAFSIRCVD